MDEILESLSTTIRISLEDDDVALIHPRYAQYKPKRTFNQEERRRQWLLEQKEKRLDSFIVNRGIEDVEDETSDDEGEAMILGDVEKKTKRERDVCLTALYVGGPAAISNWLPTKTSSVRLDCPGTTVDALLRDSPFFSPAVAGLPLREA
ncbi:hypothetical protein GE061_008379 [Apolygus lucorum]|uniref:Snurportin-1 N-terminal domain-containing protein n=1 Tax=Apolygus lucorum TaxID=248454 RepID=A0A8S9WPP9_APOLU|nr:hypothetical protein GE061_008379 [Apolygus lucorum]